MATNAERIVDEDDAPPPTVHHVRNLTDAVHALIMTLTRGAEREARIIERDARMHSSLDQLVKNTGEILIELRKRPA